MPLAAAAAAAAASCLVLTLVLALALTLALALALALVLTLALALALIRVVVCPLHLPFSFSSLASHLVIFALYVLCGKLTSSLVLNARYPLIYRRSQLKVRSKAICATPPIPWNLARRKGSVLW